MQQDQLTAQKTVRDTGVVAIIRGNYSTELLARITSALYEGGIRALEVTLNSSDALNGIEAIKRMNLAGLCVGAGTVRTERDVTNAVTAGAQFLVSPNLDLDSVRRAQQLNILHLPGVFTSTEVQTAFSAGASMVKVFPCNIAGPAYIRSIRAPLKDVEMVAVGGVHVGNAAAFIQAGAVAVAAGSSLVAGSDQDSDDLITRARQLLKVVREARSEAKNES